MYRYLRMTFISILTEKQEHLPTTHTHTRLTHSDSARIRMYTGALTHNAHTHTTHSLRQRTYTHVHRSTYPQRTHTHDSLTPTAHVYTCTQEHLPTTHTHTRLTHSDSARIHMYTGASIRIQSHILIMFVSQTSRYIPYRIVQISSEL